MKIGGLEGSPSEIKDALENNGMNLGDYLKQPESPIKMRYIVVPCVLFIVGIVGTVFLIKSSTPSETSIDLVNLFSVGSGLWLTLSVHLRFKCKTATIATALGLILMVAMANEVATISDALDLIKSLMWKTD